MIGEAREQNIRPCFFSLVQKELMCVCEREKDTLASCFPLLLIGRYKSQRQILRLSLFKYDFRFLRIMCVCLVMMFVDRDDDINKISTNGVRVIGPQICDARVEVVLSIHT